MKRRYKKPTLIVESFMLSQTIASNCGENLDLGMATMGTKETCGWDIGGIEIFMDPAVCDLPTEFFEGVCYHAPEGGMNVFGS